MTTIDWSRPVCARCGLRNAALPLTTCGDCYREVHGDTPETRATLARLEAGGELHRRRQALGLTLKALAAILGIDWRSVWRWEHGQRTPPDYLDAALWAVEHGWRPKKIPEKPAENA